jgi:hypothetical protein
MMRNSCLLLVAAAEEAQEEEAQEEFGAFPQFQSLHQLVTPLPSAPVGLVIREQISLETAAQTLLHLIPPQSEAAAAARGAVVQIIKMDLMVDQVEELDLTL